MGANNLTFTTRILLLFGVRVVLSLFVFGSRRRSFEAVQIERRGNLLSARHFGHQSKINGAGIYTDLCGN